MSCVVYIYHTRPSWSFVVMLFVVVWCCSCFLSRLLLSLLVPGMCCPAGNGSLPGTNWPRISDRVQPVVHDGCFSACGHGRPQHDWYYEGGVQDTTANCIGFFFVQRFLSCAHFALCQLSSQAWCAMHVCALCCLISHARIANNV